MIDLALQNVPQQRSLSQTRPAEWLGVAVANRDAKRRRWMEGYGVREMRSAKSRMNRKGEP
jgi:hypothetical protein